MTDVEVLVAAGEGLLRRASERRLFTPSTLAGGMETLDVLVAELDDALSRGRLDGLEHGRPAWADDPALAHVREGVGDEALPLVEAAAFHVARLLVESGRDGGLTWAVRPGSGVDRLVVVDRRGVEVDAVFHTYLALYRRRAAQAGVPTLGEEVQVILHRSTRTDDDLLRESLATSTPRKRFRVHRPPSGLLRRRPPLDRGVLEAGLESLTGRPVDLGSDPSQWVGRVALDTHEQVLLSVEPSPGQSPAPGALVVTVLWGGDEPRRGGQREALELLLGRVRGLAQTLGAQVEDLSPAKGADASW